MAITTTNQPVAPLTTSDAGFRAWGKATTDAVDDLGFTQVYSNIDWTTVTMPTTANGVAGKRVYKFNDTHSATQEIYFSLEFCRGDTTSAYIGMRISVVVGTTHDGNGTVGGLTMSHYIRFPSTSSLEGEVVGVRTDAGLTVFSNIPYTGTYTGQWVFNIERLRENGAVTPDGAVIFVHAIGVNGSGTNGSPGMQATNFALATVYSSYTQQLFPIAAVSASSNIVIDYKTPIYHINTFGKYDPFLGVILHTRSIADLSIFSAEVDGEFSTYRSSSQMAGVDTYSNGNFRVGYLVA